MQRQSVTFERTSQSANVLAFGPLERPLEARSLHSHFLDTYSTKARLSIWSGWSWGARITRDTRLAISTTGAKRSLKHEKREDEKMKRRTTMINGGSRLRSKKGL